MKVQIINDQFSDYHIHSSFSDGTATVEEIVQYAGILNMQKIAITDHSDAMVKILKERYGITPSGGARYALNSWKNVHNDVKVIFGVEGDVLNKYGDVCLEHQKMESTFTILSIHRNCYQSEHSTATEGLLNAIERHHEKIDLIAHPYDTKELGEYIDIRQVVELANNYNIPLEFNHGTFAKNRDIRENLIYMLENAKQIYVNSDAHNLSSLKNFRKESYDFLVALGLY